MRASILAGPDVEVVDVSPHGLQVESDVRLTPGAGICLTIKVDGQSHLVGGRVARVDATLAGKTVKYRAGIALDSAFAPFELPVLEKTAPSSETVPADVPATEPAGEHAREHALAPGLGPQQETELSALRSALEEQRREQEHGLRVVDMLKAALRASERSRKDADETHKQERDDWEQQRRALEEVVELSRRHERDLTGQAAAATERERAVAGRLEEERAAWLSERGTLHEDLRAAKARSEDVDHELDALRGSYQVLERSLEEERAMLAGLLQEKERLLAELEASRLMAEETSKARDQAERERQLGAAERQGLVQQLEVTESWCTDQQELIYQLWQETLRASALIDGWQSSERRGSAAKEGQPRPGDVVDGPLVAGAATAAADAPEASNAAASAVVL